MTGTAGQVIETHNFEDLMGFGGGMGADPGIHNGEVAVPFNAPPESHMDPPDPQVIGEPGPSTKLAQQRQLSAHNPQGSVLAPGPFPHTYSKPSAKPFVDTDGGYSVAGASLKETAKDAMSGGNMYQNVHGSVTSTPGIETTGGVKWGNPGQSTEDLAQSIHESNFPSSEAVTPAENLAGVARAQGMGIAKSGQTMKPR